VQCGLVDEGLNSGGKLDCTGQQVAKGSGEVSMLECESLVNFRLLQVVAGCFVQTLACRCRCYT